MVEVGAPGGTVLDALALATAVVDDLVVATARDSHDAIARRMHGLVRALVPIGSAPETVHRGIASGVYGGIGLALRGSSVGIGRLAATGRGPRLDAGPRGRFVASAVNGLIGDELVRDRPRLAIPMAVRRDGRDVPLTSAALTAAFPDATGRIVLFLHGLCEDESCWRRHRDRTGTTYPETLAVRGWTPVLLRANTGLSIRENGVALAALVADLVAGWPVPVERIAVVGHSMGGLIIRAATGVLGDTDEPWTARLTDVITLATPHRGAPLARGAGHGSALLGRLPETAAYGRILDRRSAGVRDLVDGLADVSPLDHVRYRLVAATLTNSARHPVGAAFGDLLVRPRSAVGYDRAGRELFPGADLLHVGRSDHLGVLNHPEVAAALERWLG